MGITDGLGAHGVEKMQDQEQIQTYDVEVFDNSIAAYLKMFCEEQGIEYMSKESQSKWNAAMMYIKRHVFNDSSILKMSKPLEGYINNNYTDNRSNVNSSNCNAYDIDKVNSICDYYIYICNMYDKGVTISGFSKLTGITEETIYDWGREDSRSLSSSSSAIYKKLHSEYENSLESKLWSNKNPVAHMAIANRRFGWNMPGVREERSKQRVLTVDELPRLTLDDNSPSNCTNGLLENTFDKAAES